MPSRRIVKFTVSPTCAKRIRKMAEGNLADVWFLVVAILINRLVRYGKNYVSFAQSGFLGGTSGTDFRDVDAAVFVQPDVASKLRVAGGRKGQAGPRKPWVAFKVRIGEKVRDYRRRDYIGRLAAGVIAHEKTEQSSVAQRGNGEASFAVLKRSTDPVGQECDMIERISGDRDGRNDTRCVCDLPVGFELKN